MNYSKLLSFLGLLCSSSLLYSLWNLPYRTGITNINTTRVKIINNTKRTFIAKNILVNQQKVKGGVVGYILGSIKTKRFSDKIIKPGKTKSIFLIDRDLPVGALYGTINERNMPYEEWAMDIINQNDPTCKFGAIIRASRGKMTPSTIGYSFVLVKPALEIARNSYYTDLVLGTGVGSIAIGLAVAGTAIALPVTVAIDTIAYGVGQLIGSIGTKIINNPTCARISYEYKWQGGLYKNLIITINPK